MESLQELLEPLSAPHQQALRWFAERANQIVSWPEPLGEDLYLATQAKGIYKPSWSTYALSVRQTLGSKYPDREPVIRPDGTWKYEYFQEGEALRRDRYFTNRGLMACIREKVPVGVMRQVDSRSPVRYQVLGVALPSQWRSGYYRLEGFGPGGFAHPADSTVASNDGWVPTLGMVANDFNVEKIRDSRRRAIAAIVVRRGQGAFRRKLLKAYTGRCAVTGTNAELALEAAHIIPYLGPDTDHVSNGLVLRADIHTLFDLGALAIDTASMTVLIAPTLLSTSYAELAGAPLRRPDDASCKPNSAALDLHREYAEAVWAAEARTRERPRRVTAPLFKPR
jgi:hypothetical protein